MPDDQAALQLNSTYKSFEQALCIDLEEDVGGTLSLPVPGRGVTARKWWPSPSPSGEDGLRHHRL